MLEVTTIWSVAGLLAARGALLSLVPALLAAQSGATGTVTYVVLRTGTAELGKWIDLQPVEPGSEAI